jgi:hypothetical protein
MITAMFSWKLNAQFIYGIKAGVNLSYNRIDDGLRNVVLGDFKPIPGFNAGLIGEYRIKEWMSVQLQLNYDKRGANYYEEKYELGNRKTIDANINLHYLELPVLIKFHKVLNEKKKQGIHAKLGPSLAYLFSGRMKGTKSYNEETTEVNEMVNANAVKSTFGLTAVAGFFFPVKSSRGFIELRYNHGFTNIFQGSEEVPDEELKAYGSVFSINFGMIGFSKWDKY